MRIRCRRSVLRLVVVILLAGLSSAAIAAPPEPTLAPDGGDEQEVLITIRARQFVPDRANLSAGRKTKLVLYNQDAELHAFVPLGLFEGIHLNIAGNGAPEFTAQGLKRVIIPSEGRAEFRFIPERPGVFPYICDMPGHEMKAAIIVH